MEIEKNSWQSDWSKRTVSPFFIYFIIAWIIHNHDVFAALIYNGMDPIEKSGYISTSIASTNDMVWIPLKHAAKIFALWLVVHFVSSIAWDMTKFLTEKVKKIFRRDIMSKTEKEMDDIQKDYENKISEKNETIVSLRNNISGAYDKIDILKTNHLKEISTVKKDLDSKLTEIELMKVVSNEREKELQDTKDKIQKEKDESTKKAIKSSDAVATNLFNAFIKPNSPIIISSNRRFSAAYLLRSTNLGTTTVEQLNELRDMDFNPIAFDCYIMVFQEKTESMSESPGDMMQERMNLFSLKNSYYIITNSKISY